jgi:hypothetical protein
VTPNELVLYVRQQYNAVGNTFFSDSELFSHIWNAQGRLAREALCIERVYTTTTVASQQEYSYPTNTIGIKRITYDGRKLSTVTMREDDALTLSNSTTAATGTPQYFYIWNQTLYLRPVPDTALTLKIFSYNEPQEVTSASSIEVPTMFHMDLADFVLAKMSLKDQNFDGYSLYNGRWEYAVMKAKRDMRKLKRTESYTSIQDLELLATTVIGAV